MTSETSMQERSAYARLRWLMFFRVVILSFLLGVAAFIQFIGTESLSQVSLFLVYGIIGITYIFSILYVFILSRLKNVQINVYIQSLVDVVLVTALVYVTGGAGSLYSNLYSLVIICSVLFLEMRGGILIASISSILYGLLLDMEYYGVIQPIYGEMYEYDFSAGYVFSRIFIHIVSFYIIALLASFVVGQEKKTKVLLREQRDAFNQLDLLHTSIIESVNAGIITVDLEHRVRSFNKAAESIMKMKPYQAIDRDIEYLFPGVLGAMERMGGTNGNFEMTRTLGNDRQVILGFSVSPLIGQDMTSIGNIFIFRDLTEIKAMEREVEKSKKFAFIGEMAAVLAHELRNPLASIGGSIQLLQRDLILDAGDRKLMDIILRGKDQLEALAREFLLFSKPHTGDQAILDIHDIINDIIDSVHSTGELNGSIELKTEFSDQNTIHGNRTEIRHALLNIVINGLQSMQKGGTLSITTRRIDDALKGECIEIAITDTGCGIGNEDLAKVQEPFYTTKETGTGLGLAMVNRVVSGHKGRFGIMSEINTGTRCVVVLPCGENLQQ